jgi:hypothetical protein
MLGWFEMPRLDPRLYARVALNKSLLDIYKKTYTNKRIGFYLSSL